MCFADATLSHASPFPLPSSVTSIGDYAFSGCRSLKSVTIFSSVKTIRTFAFDECSSLVTINIPPSVTTIGDGAFYRCTSLVTITIPSSVSSIGERAIGECSPLKSISLSPSQSRFLAIEKPMGWRSRIINPKLGTLFDVLSTKMQYEDAMDDDDDKCLYSYPMAPKLITYIDGYHKQKNPQRDSSQRLELIY